MTLTRRAFGLLAAAFALPLPARVGADRPAWPWLFPVRLRVIAADGRVMAWAGVPSVRRTHRNLAVLAAGVTDRLEVWMGDRREPYAMAMPPRCCMPGDEIAVAIDEVTVARLNRMAARDGVGFAWRPAPTWPHLA